MKKADNIPHILEGEDVLFDHIPKEAIGVLDLGTGDGRLLRLSKNKIPDMRAVAMDVSPIMLESVKSNFANESSTNNRT